MLPSRPSTARVRASRQSATPAAATAILVAVLKGVLRGTLGGHRPPTPGLFGGPGLGKTTIVRDAAELTEFALVEVYLNTREPESLLGCYVPDASGVSMVFPPAEFAEQTIEGVASMHRHWEANGRIGPEPMLRPTVFFLDEYTAARPEVMQASERMLLERRLPNGWHFHDRVVFIIAGNLPEHGPTISELAPTTKTRLWPVLSIEADVSSWLAWARARDLNSALIAWVAQDPSSLYDMDSSRDALTFSVPRTLERLHDVIALFAHDPNFGLVVQGTIGERAGALFFEFFNFGRSNPTPEAVIELPEQIDVPTHPASLAQLSEALVQYCRHDTSLTERLFRFVARMPAQFQEFIVDAMLHDRDGIVSPEVRKAAASSPLLVGILRGRASDLKAVHGMSAPLSSGNALLS